MFNKTGNAIFHQWCSNLGTNLIGMRRWIRLTKLRSSLLHQSRAWTLTCLRAQLSQGLDNFIPFIPIYEHGRWLVVWCSSGVLPELIAKWRDVVCDSQTFLRQLIESLNGHCGLREPSSCYGVLPRHLEFLRLRKKPPPILWQTARVVR